MEHSASAATTSVIAVTVCLVLLCLLLLAAIIGTGLHCRIKLQSYNESWAEERKQTLVELSECKAVIISVKMDTNHSTTGQDCKDRGADLVVVNSKEEQVFSNSLKHLFWIGLTDAEEDGTWKWVDGSGLNSTGFWSTGQPSGRFGEVKEDCVSTFSYQEQRSWNDDNCAKSQLWICEKVTDF